MGNNKLVQRYHEIEAEVEVIRQMVTRQADSETIQARVTELEAKQADLKKTLLHLVALSKIRDEAWLALRVE